MRINEKIIDYLSEINFLPSPNILELKFHVNEDSSEINAVFTISALTKERYIIAFTKIQDLQIDGILRPGIRYGLDIYDKTSDQWEGVHGELYDYEEKSIHFFFDEIEIEHL